MLLVFDLKGYFNKGVKRIHFPQLKIWLRVKCKFINAGVAGAG